MKAILVIDTDEKIIERLSKIDTKEMCVDIGFDYHLDCNGRGGWCFHRPKSLLGVKPIPQEKDDFINEDYTKEEELEYHYNSGWNDCINEILGGKNEAD